MPNALTRKIAGVPAWGWGLGAAAIAGVYIWRKRAAASAAAAQAASAGSTTGTTSAANPAPAGNYGAPYQSSGEGGGGGLASILGSLAALQPTPAASSSAPGVATASLAPGETQLGSGYGILNSDFPSQGVLSIPTPQGTFTEANSSGNASYGGQPITTTAGTYYQPQPGVFSPVQSGDTLNPGTPVFTLAASPPAST